MIATDRLAKPPKIAKGWREVRVDAPGEHRSTHCVQRHDPAAEGLQGHDSHCFPLHGEEPEATRPRDAITGNTSRQSTATLY